MKRTLTILLFLCTVQLQAQTGSEENRYLLVLDIQNHFTSTIFPEEEKRAGFIKTINTVIENTNPEKVIYVESISAQLALSFSRPKVTFPFDLHLDNHLNIVNQNYIIKKHPDVFQEQEMLNLARNNNITEFVVIGLAAEHCVLESLLGGQKRGYKMTIIPEAVAGTTPEDKKEALEKIREAGISIVQIDDFL